VRRSYCGTFSYGYHQRRCCEQTHQCPEQAQEIQASVSGTYIPASNTISRAVAHIIGSATIPVATLASISVYPSQSLSLNGASNVVIDVAPSASLSVSGEMLFVDAQGGFNAVNMVSNGGSLSIGGNGSQADITLTGGNGGRNVFGLDSAQANLRGDNYEAAFFEMAVAQVYGSAVLCRASEVSLASRLYI